MDRRFYGSNESVPTPSDRLDVLRRGRRVSEEAPHFVDGIVQAVVEVDEGVCGPEPGAKLLAQDDFARMLEERLQHLEWLVLQPHSPSVLAYLSSLDIHLKGGEPEHSWRLGTHPGLVGDGRASPGATWWRELSTAHPRLLSLSRTACCRVSGSGAPDNRAAMDCVTEVADHASRNGGTHMTRIRLTTTFCAFLLTAFAGTGISPKLAAAPAAPNINEDVRRSLLRRFVVDVAIGRTDVAHERRDQPVLPAVHRTVVPWQHVHCQRKIYRGGTLKSGGDFGEYR